MKGAVNLYMIYLVVLESVSLGNPATYVSCGRAVYLESAEHLIADTNSLALFEDVPDGEVIDRVVVAGGVCRDATRNDFRGLPPVRARMGTCVKIAATFIPA